mgnify:CR=1 FL=1
MVFTQKIHLKKTTGYGKTPRNLESLINKGFLTIFRAPLPISHLRNVYTKL